MMNFKEIVSLKVYAVGGLGCVLPGRIGPVCSSGAGSRHRVSEWITRRDRGQSPAAEQIEEDVVDDRNRP